MKNNYINLLINREDYKKYENLFEYLKLTAAILTVILSILFAYFFFSIKNEFDIFEKMNLQKKVFLQLLTSRRGDEAKINYIQKKYLHLKTFLMDDASSVTYYQLLSDAINNRSESASLKSFEVNKDRVTSFIISFSTFNELMNFLKFAESEPFFSNFENVSLKNLIIIGSKEKNQNYELSFVGKFVPVKPDINNL